MSVKQIDENDSTVLSHKKGAKATINVDDVVCSRRIDLHTLAEVAAGGLLLSYIGAAGASASGYNAAGALLSCYYSTIQSWTNGLHEIVLAVLHVFLDMWMQGFPHVWPYLDLWSVFMVCGLLVKLGFVASLRQ